MYLFCTILHQATASQFQYPQAGRERTVLLAPLEGKYTHQTRKGQVQMHLGGVA
jgi:hypothetical protein